MKLTIIKLFILFSGSVLQSQTILEADGSGKAGILINSILDPDRGRALESPGIKKGDCDNHSNAKDPHITEIFDNELNKYVFKFSIHLNEDNDRCKKFDRQRNEIKTYRASPDSLKGTKGETVEYIWKFKLDTNFKPSKNFTHIHQLKSVDEQPKSKPIITLTPRKGNPDQLELRYSNGPEKGVILKKVDLDLFRGKWVKVTETVTYDTKGSYKIDIIDIKTEKNILNFKSENLILWQNGASFIRPKWGIYRSLKTAKDLRDEDLFFADFSIIEK
ncbi:heparin lyase I family protein [Flavivirga jejuensis]|uniref:Fibronectin type III n=1 Tax=Flavivirga jejuensis TaxID=870487 RepID=A0ABT8WIA3_9FLAO|nr:fibronectin type III [Flavivirga jejuensis]MDO5972858.1 fibronectin type III [Flavivirga jejuensis]